MTSNRVSTALSRRCTGHVDTVVQLEAHRSLPLLASVDQSRRVLVWNTADTTFSDTAFVLTDLAVLIPDEVPHVAWDLKDSVLYVTSSKRISAFYIPVLEVIETQAPSYSQNAPATAALAPMAASSPTPVLSSIAPQVQPILIGYLSASSPLNPSKVGVLASPSAETSAKKSFVFAISSCGTKISLWSVTKPDLTDKNGAPVPTPDEPLSSDLLLDAREILQPDESISCMCLPDSVELETTQLPRQQAVGCSLLTGGDDGHVRGWTFSISGSSASFAECFRFKAAESALTRVESAFLGRIATTSQQSRVVDIWESESHVPTFLHEASLEIFERTRATAPSLRREASTAFKPVMLNRNGTRSTAVSPAASERSSSVAKAQASVSFSWLCLVSGGQILAVVVGSEVQLWCLRRSSDLFSFRPQWSRVDSLSAGADVRDSSVAWTSLGQLVLANGSQLSVMSQWLDSNQGTIPRLVEDENRALPLYHPKALVECLMTGKLDCVHLILKHVYAHFQATDADRRKKLKERFLARQRESEGATESEDQWDLDAEERALDQLDPEDALSDLSSAAKASDAAVPPLLLSSFPTEVTQIDDGVAETSSAPASAPLAAAPVVIQAAPPPPKKEDLFDDDPYSNLSYDSWDALGADSDTEKEDAPEVAVLAPLPTPSAAAPGSYIQPFEWNFETISSSDARKLASRLGEVSLAGLGPHEQIYLMALLDTLSSLERSWVDMAAVRFALTVRYFHWMKRTNRLPTELRESRLGTSPNHTLASLSWCWGLHCSDHQQLVDLCIPPADLNACVWENVRMFGIPLWCSDNTVLRQLAERLAKQHFLLHRDPADCALFYILLGKKGALQTLYKTARDDKLAGFLSNDFSQDRWKEAALKNAYALLGRQRYYLAAAFFLLGSATKDAITVCLSNLDDWLLALFIARIQEGDQGASVQDVFASHILPKASQSGDLALLSASHWFLGDYRKALTCLIPPGSETRSPREFNPGILYLFTFLAKHPRVKLLSINDELEELRRSLEGMAVFAYTRSGLSWLALQSSSMQRWVYQLKGHTDTAGEVVAGMHRRALQQFVTKELESTKFEGLNSLDHVTKDMGYLASRFGVAESSLLSPLLHYCEARLLVRPNYLFLRSHDAPTAARFLIRSAKRIIPICLSLVTYPLSHHHAREILRFTTELHECLGMHLATETTVSADPSGLLSSSSSLRSGTSFSRQARAAMEASIRLGLFLSAWSIGDYDVLCAIITELGGCSSLDGSAALVGNLDHLVRVAARLSPSSAFISDPDTLDLETHGFFRGLFHLLLLFKFISLLEEFLARNGFQQPGQLNMIRTLRHWLFTSESSLKDVPALIVRERFSEILHSKPKSVFDFPFFDKFVKLGATFPTSDPARKHLWESFGRDEGVVAQYLQHADFLKQGMRFVRLLHDLRSDFEEEDQKLVGARTSVDYERQASSADGPAPTLDVKDILSDIDSRLRRSPSPTPISRTPTSSVAGDSDADSVGSNDTTQSDPYYAPSVMRPLPVRPVKRRLHSSSDIRFGEALVVFRDRDILQSFCINPTRSKQMAVATTHGISEIIVSSDTHGQTVMRRSSSEPDLSSSASNLRDIRDGASTTEDDKQDIANWIEAHPTFPYYLSGSVDGGIRLWQFNVPQTLATYREKSASRLSKLRFNWNGTKFAAADQNGSVQLWRFDANEDSTRAFASLPCHSRKAADIVFLNSGSVLACAGESNGNKNVSIWDTLVPVARGEAASFVCQADGATAIAYSPRLQFVFCGGRQGNISVIDVRQRQIVQELEGHSRAIKDLSIDPTQSWMISGSNEGNVKIWDLSSLSVTETWEDTHSRQTFVRNAAVLGAGPISTHGVMQVKFSKNHCYTCGSDGRLVQRRFESSPF